nr:sodium-independent anion transporter [Caenimonas soli]
MDAELDFASAAAFERAVVEHLAEHPDTHHICLFAQPINRIDATGVETFSALSKLLNSRGIKLPVEMVLRRAGALSEQPQLRLYRTEADALRALSLIAA